MEDPFTLTNPANSGDAVVIYSDSPISAILQNRQYDGYRLTMQNITLLVLANPNEPELEMLRALPAPGNLVVGSRPEAFTGVAAQADVILSWSVKPALELLWKECRNVRWVHSRSAGLDGVLFPGLVESPVVLTNGRGVFSSLLAEFAVGAILFFAKDFRRMVHSQAAGEWDPFDIVDLRGQTLGIAGYGDIGRAVAQRARAFEMKILALRRDPKLSADDPLVDRVLPPEARLELMENSDYIVASLPLTEGTRGFIGDPELRAMKKSGVVINVGRGAVIDEAALVRVLEEKRILGAALDVFEAEPLPSGHPFYRLDNVLLSPHSADHSPDWKQLAMRFFLEQFERFARGEPLLNVVNKRAGY